MSGSTLMRNPADTDVWTVCGGSPAADAGPVRADGFKHLLVPSLAAACLAGAPWEFTNVPDIADRHALGGIVSALGGRVEHDGDRMTVDPRGLTGHEIPAALSQGVHGGMYLLPTLLAARGRVVSGTHGGCSIGDGAGGARPTGHVARVLEAFGATCEATAGGFSARAPRGGLRGATLDMADFADVEPATGTLTGPYYSGATKTALLAAATATGTTEIRNPYPKLDVYGLVRVLAEAGVAVETAPGRIVVEGVGGPLGAARVTVPSDLMEVVTFVALAVHLRRPLELALDGAEEVRAGLAPELRYLDAMGVPLEWGPSSLRIGEPARLRATDVLAASHFAYSDAQPLFALMLLGADGPATLTDLVWHGGRFGYAEGLRALGARLDLSGNRLTTTPSRLRPAGTDLVAGDLRAAATLVLAALGTGVPQRLVGVGHLRRGYQDLAAKLTSLGATITPEDAS
ncbi:MULTISPECIES: hypothetical protein [unclassified Streptomyces]|uniref:hypothetical protein n=1 Tax=unclassified Streptomyces TaxID=2593676 RepID=UPI0036FB15C9